MLPYGASKLTHDSPLLSDKILCDQQRGRGHYSRCVQGAVKGRSWFASQIPDAASKTPCQRSIYYLAKISDHCRQSFFIDKVHLRAMRRSLLIVLSVVFLLKAVAAAAVPITGGWSHTHETSHSEAHVDAAHGSQSHDSETTTTQSHCAAFAEDSGESTPVHEHSCPHMGMVSMIAPIFWIPEFRAAPESPVESQAVFVSVIQEVPSPPPTFLR
jgi:hypothetical protein